MASLFILSVWISLGEPILLLAIARGMKSKGLLEKLKANVSLLWHILCKWRMVCVLIVPFAASAKHNRFPICRLDHSLLIIFI
jgi:hypothetical protein